MRIFLLRYRAGVFAATLLLVIFATCFSLATFADAISKQSNVGKGVTRSLAIKAAQSMVNGPKILMLQKTIDDLKAGIPQVVTISFEHSAVIQEGRTEKQLRHLSYDDDKILEMKRARYKSLKAEALSGYGISKLTILKDYSSTAQVVARIADFETLELLLNDPRVSHVNAAMPIEIQSTDENEDWENIVYQPPVFANGFTGKESVIVVIDAAADVDDGTVDWTGNVMPTASTDYINHDCENYFPICNIAADAYCAPAGNGSINCQGCDWVNGFNGSPETMNCGGTVTQFLCANGGTSTGAFPTCINDEHQLLVITVAADIAPDARFDAITLAPAAMSPTGLTDALQWVVNNVPDESVVNISMGTPQTFSGSCTNIAENEALEALHEKGIAVVVSAGNHGAGFVGPQGLMDPACSPYVISVGSVTIGGDITHVFDLEGGGTCDVYGLNVVEPADTMPCFSNYDSSLVITASGIFDDAGDLDNLQGTSFSAPIISGAVAILHSIRPDSGDVIKSRMVAQADTINIQFSNGATGTAPRLNLVKAVSATTSIGPMGGSGNGGGGSNNNNGFSVQKTYGILFPLMQLLP